MSSLRVAVKNGFLCWGSQTQVYKSGYIRPVNTINTERDALKPVDDLLVTLNGTVISLMLLVSVIKYF